MAANNLTETQNDDCNKTKLEVTWTELEMMTYK